MKQNLLNYTPEDVFGLPGLDEKYRWAAIDETGELFYYLIEPSIMTSDNLWGSDGSLSLIRMPLKTDYAGDWRDSKIQRPIKIELGQFGKFWNTYPEKVSYGYLFSIINADEYPYKRTGDKVTTEDDYKNFEPCDPATLPKRIEIKG